MKNKLKVIGIITLAVVFAFAVIGCGENDINGDGDDDEGRGPQGSSFPYKLENDDTLIINFIQTGDGTVYPPSDSRCPRFILDTSTQGTFPVGKWNDSENSKDSSRSRTFWVEFKNDGSFEMYYIQESNFKYSSNDKEITFIWN